jgi:serine/threonine protein kinase
MAAPPDALVTHLGDRYRFERELGQGGMATVYLARDLKHDRLVAVKTLRSEIAASLGRQRFLREIQIASQLSHPHILPLHDSGDVDGLLFYMMPYVQGESVRDLLRRDGRLPLDLAVRLAREMAKALDRSLRAVGARADQGGNGVMGLTTLQRAQGTTNHVATSSPAKMPAGAIIEANGALAEWAYRR